MLRLPKYTGTPASVRLVIGAEGVPLEGLVVDPDGQPAPGARVAISVDESARTLRQLPNGDHERETPPVVVQADRAGRFATGCVPAGEHWVAASAPGAAAVVVKASVPCPPESPLVVRLSRGATVRGVVRDGAGQPVAARLWTHSPMGTTRGLFPLVTNLGLDQASAESGPDGAFTLRHVMPGKTQLGCGAKDMAYVTESVLLEADQVLEWNPVLAALAEIRGKVVGAEGKALAGWIVKQQSQFAATSGYGIEASTDGEGRFTLTGLEPGSYAVWALPAQAAGVAKSVHWGRTHAPTGKTDLVVRTEWNADGGAFFVGTVVNGSDGRPVRSARIKIYPKVHGWDHDQEEKVAEADAGRFRIGPLPPDTYQIDVSTPDHDQLRMDQRLDAGQTLDLGALLMESKGTLTLALTLPPGCKEEEVVIQVRTDRSSGWGHLFERTGPATWRSRGLSSSWAKLVEIWGPGIARLERGFEVEPGADTRIEAKLEPATPVRFVLAQPEPRSPRWTDGVSIVLRDAQGREAKHSFEVDGGDTFAWARGLEAGRWEYEAASYSDPACRASGSFVVPALGNQPGNRGAAPPVIVRIDFPRRAEPAPVRGAPTRR
jgi:hypothetical protein